MATGAGANGWAGARTRRRVAWLGSRRRRWCMRMPPSASSHPHAPHLALPLISSAAGLDLPKLGQYLDYINIMT